MSVYASPLRAIVVLFLFLFPGFNQGFAQKDAVAEINGVVSDNAMHSPLEGVNITLLNSISGTASAANGKFRISGLAAGDYLLRAEHIGYQPLEKRVAVAAGENLTLHIYLSRKAIEMEELVVLRDRLVGSLGGLENIPGSANFIGPEELATHGYNDVHRALGKIPGINVQEEDGYGLRPNIGFRGTGSERSQKIALMEDGVLAAPAPYAAPAAYYFPTVGRMQGIEVRKGSSQIKYGPYTTGGALNLISTAIPDGFDAALRMLGGSNFGRTVHGTAGASSSNAGILLETHQSGSQGFKKIDGGGDSGFIKQDYLAKVRLNTRKGSHRYQELTFKAGYTKEDSDETYLGLTMKDFQEEPLRRYAASREDRMKADHWQFALRHFAQLTAHLDITTTAYRNTFERNWYKLDNVKFADHEVIGIADVLDSPGLFADEYSLLTGTSSPNDDALRVKANNRSYDSRGIQSTLGLQGRRGELRSDLVIGLRVHRDEMDRFQWVDDYRMDNGELLLTRHGTPGSDSNRLETAEAYAGFLEYTLVYRNLTVVPGLRYEDISIRRRDYGRSDAERTGTSLNKRENRVTILVPGIGAAWRINSHLHLFSGIHKGFAPPGSLEGSEPESSINYESGLRLQRESLRGEVVLFYNDYRNLLGLDLNAGGGSGSGDLFNGGAATVYGSEVSLSYDVARLWNLPLVLPVQAAYTFTRAVFDSDFQSEFEPWGDIRKNFELPYVPVQQLSLDLGLLVGRFFADTRAKYTSAMRSVAGKGAIPADTRIDAHLVLDSSLEYRAGRNQTISLLIRNLTNNTYVAARRPAGLRPGLPRTILLGLKLGF